MSTQSEMLFMENLPPAKAVELFYRYHDKNPLVYKALWRAARAMAPRARISLCIHAVYWHARNKFGISCAREFLPAYALMLAASNDALRFEHRSSVFSGLLAEAKQ